MAKFNVEMPKEILKDIQINEGDAAAAAILHHTRGGVL